MDNNENINAKNDLVEGVDYYINNVGLLVFTKEYHLKRGNCCKNRCINCPYGFNENKDIDKKSIK